MSSLPAASTRATRIRRKILENEELRANLPVGAYVKILHEAAVTGFMPRFTPAGQPTGQFDSLEPRERLDLTKYLIDKALPNAAAPKTAEVIVEDDRAHRAERLTNPSNQDIAKLTEEELAELADAQYEILNTTPSSPASP